MLSVFGLDNKNVFFFGVAGDGKYCFVVGENLSLLADNEGSIFISLRNFQRSVPMPRPLFFFHAVFQARKEMSRCYLLRDFLLSGRRC